MDDTRWMTRAACRDADPELFFAPGDKTRMASEQLKRARAVCRGCVVRKDCLRYALDNPEEAASGVWGGSTPEQRQWARDLDLEVA